jgi:adenylate cyclase
VVFPALGLPGWSITLVLVILVVGFPLALVLSWLFDFTAQGVQRTADVPAVSSSDATVPEQSIAVLPFPDMSAEHDQEHFCDGLTEELLNVFTRVPNLRVASRTSCFAFKDANVDMASIAEKLCVRHVLEGSVRKAGNRIRVTAQLIEVATDSHVWSETYDRELEDIFAIQEDIAGRILDALHVTLGAETLVQPTTDNPRAYEYFLRGRGYAIKGGEDDMKMALSMFRKAVQIDPDFTRAWIELAEICAISAVFFKDKERWRALAEEAGNNAVRLAPNQAESYLAQGFSHAALADFSEAEVYYRKALELEPALAKAHFHLARTCLHRGKLRPAAEHFMKTSECDPDDFVAPLLAVATWKKIGLQHEARRAALLGVERAERILEDYPDNQRAYYLGVGALLELGQKERAVEWAERAYEIRPDDPATLYNLACFYANVGETDRALDYIERSVTSRSWLEHDPDMDPLRDQPRFKALLERLSD